MPATAFASMNRAMAVAATSALLLGACGGGGGSGSGGPVVTAAAITSSNYVAVGQESVDTSFYVNDTSRILVGAQVIDSSLALNMALAQVKRLPGWIARAPHLVGGAVTSETDSCSGGGSVTVTSTDVNGNGQTDVGDSASAVFSNCIESGVTMSGHLSLSVSTLSGNLDSDAYSATIAINLDGFGARVGSATSSGSGTLTLTVTSRAANDLSLTIAVPTLSVSANLGGTSVTRSATDLNVSMTRTPSGFSAWNDAVTVSGTISSTAIGSGSVTIATVTPFVTPSSAVYPASGQLTATGANGSRMRLTALSSSQVRIELDADGNGSYETSTTKAWSELR